MTATNHPGSGKRPSGKGPRTKKQARKVEARTVAEKNKGWR